jgi:hypothetical protein
LKYNGSFESPAPGNGKCTSAAIARLAIRLRRSARCAACGARGATLMLPSWGDTQVGFAAFPAERL